MVLAAEDLEAALAYHREQDAWQRESREAFRQDRLEAARQAIREWAPNEPALRGVYLFGSILQPGQFSPRSDLDVAVDSDAPEAESRLWVALEEALGMAVDLRPLAGVVARAVERAGECVYARRSPRP